VQENGPVYISSETTAGLKEKSHDILIKKESSAYISAKKMGLMQQMEKTLNDQIADHTRRSAPRNSLFYKLLPVFIILMAIFILSIISIMIIVFSIKYYRYYRYKKRKNIWEIYKDTLINYLNEKNEGNLPGFPELKKSVNKKIIIEQLYELANIIYGQKQIKLKNVYKYNELQPYMLKKIKNGSRPIKSVYLKYLSIRPFRDNILINFSKLTVHPNPQIRMYSQLAYISQFSDHALSFLKNYPYRLSEWDQMNLYETMIHNSIPVPDLYAYLYSGNDSVIIFALRLIRWYYLKSKDAGELLQLLGHSNDKVRLEAYKTLVELKFQGVDDIFRNYYLKESKPVKKLMIDYFIRKRMLRKTMYRELLDIETDNEMLFYLLESFYNQSLNSQEELRTLREQTDSGPLRLMCDHIIENGS
jgi:hypothetical protein